MTLFDRCKTLRQEIEQYSGLRIENKEAEAYRERTGQLRSQMAQLTVTQQKLTVLKRRKVPLKRIPKAESAKSALSDVQTKLSSEPNEIGKDAGRLKKALDKLNEDLVECYSSAIKDVLESIPTVDEPFLRQVELIPECRAKVVEIRRIRDSLLQRARSQRLNPDELDALLTERDSLRGLADGLSPKDFPKEVLAFFRAARHGGATYDKLTESVLSWLDERDQVKKLRITIVE